MCHLLNCSLIFSSYFCKRLLFFFLINYYYFFVTKSLSTTITFKFSNFFIYFHNFSGTDEFTRKSFFSTHIFNLLYWKKSFWIHTFSIFCIENVIKNYPIVFENLLGTKKLGFLVRKSLNGKKKTVNLRW